MWRITKVKRLGFVRKCSSIQSVCLLIKKLGLCCQKVEAPTDNVSDNRGKAEPTHKRTVKLPTQLITTLQVTTQVSVTIDEVTRPTGCIFLQSIIYEQCSRTSVADIKMLRFLTYTDLSKEIYEQSKEIPVISVNYMKQNA